MFEGTEMLCRSMRQKDGLHRPEMPGIAVPDDIPTNAVETFVRLSFLEQMRTPPCVGANVDHWLNHRNATGHDLMPSLGVPRNGMSSSIVIHELCRRTCLPHSNAVLIGVPRETYWRSRAINDARVLSELCTRMVNGPRIGLSTWALTGLGVASYGSAD